MASGSSTDWNQSGFRVLVGKGYSCSGRLREVVADVQRFFPPPLLHAAPPLVLLLRSISACAFFDSLASLVRLHSTDKHLLTSIWRAAETVIPDLELLPERDMLSRHLGGLVAELEICRHSSSVSNTEDDPFRDAQKPRKHLNVILDPLWARGIQEALVGMVSC